MNLFDGLQQSALIITRTVFGYDASWLPSTAQGDTAQTLTGRALLKEPTAEYELNGVTFTPFCSIMEYHRGTFSGLMEAVNSKRNERVTVNGVQYYVRTITAKYDGKTYVAVIEKIA